jgi:hypothetical protein
MGPEPLTWQLRKEYPEVELLIDRFCAVKEPL